MSEVKLTDAYILDTLVPELKEDGKSLVYYSAVEPGTGGEPVFVVSVGRAKPILRTKSSEARNTVLEELGLAPISNGKDFLLLRNRLTFPVELAHNPGLVAIVGKALTVNGVVKHVIEQMNTEGRGEPIITIDQNGVKYQRTTLKDGVETRLWRQVFVSSDPAEKNIELTFYGRLPVTAAASVGQLVATAQELRPEVPIKE